MPNVILININGLCSRAHKDMEQICNDQFDNGGKIYPTYRRMDWPTDKVDCKELYESLCHSYDMIIAENWPTQMIFWLINGESLGTLVLGAVIADNKFIRWEILA